MKRPIIFSVFFFLIFTTFSIGKGVWIEEAFDPESGLRTGKIEVNGRIYRIYPGANLFNANLSGANLSKTNLQFADLNLANL